MSAEHVDGTPGAGSADAENPLGAFMAAEERGAAKHKQIAGSPTAVQLTGAERAALTTAFEAKLPRFAGRVAQASATSVGAPFFRTVRVLRLESAVPFPACAAFAALTPSGALVLSGNPESLETLFAAERPAHMNDPDVALMLGLIVGYWTSASLHNNLRVSSVDEIPWRRACKEDQAQETAIRTMYGSQITAPTLARTREALRATLWVVSESWLRRREIAVAHGGVRVTETAVVELPVFPGRMWGNRDGRWVPIG
jgi:hypothetical protein